MDKTTKRIPWIDAAKAVGILCIVFGHMYQTGFLNKAVYSFHVPLFFFLSGTVFHYGEIGLKSMVKKRARTLLLPYYVFTLISLIVYAALGFIAQSALGGHMEYSPKEILLLSAIGYSPTNRPLWFLPCLFVMEILLWCCVRLENRTSNKRIFRGVVFGILILLTVLYAGLRHYKIPFAADKAVALLPFAYSGYCLNQRTPRMSLAAKSKALRGIGALLVLVSGVALGTCVNAKIELRNLEIGNPWVFYLSAAFSIAGIVELCNILPNTRVLQYVGKNTMPILLLHKFPVIFFQSMCPFVKHWIARGSIVGSILATIASICLCCIAGEVIRRIWPALIGYPRLQKKDPIKDAD